MAFKKIINNFAGPYVFLSNFYPCDGLWYHGVPCETLEHAYQAEKMLTVADGKRVARASTPGKAKRMAKTLPVRPDWERVKLTIMWGLLCAKFDANETLSAALVDTGRALLIEGNTWGDTYWGQCNGVGFNHLGQLLMVVRQLHAQTTEI